MGTASLDFVAELARITARASAVIFSVSLVARAMELAWPRRAFSQRDAGWKLLGALLVSHTVHFAVIAVLTVGMHGENIAARGGWILTSVVGVLFYAVTGGALVLRRAAGVAPAISNLAGDAALSVLVGLAFLQGYVGRIGASPIFTILAAVLSGALLVFLAVVAVRIVQPAGNHSVESLASGRQRVS